MPFTKRRHRPRSQSAHIPIGAAKPHRPVRPARQRTDCGKTRWIQPPRSLYHFSAIPAHHLTAPGDKPHPVLPRDQTCGQPLHTPRQPSISPVMQPRWGRHPKHPGRIFSH